MEILLLIGVIAKYVIIGLASLVGGSGVPAESYQE